MIKNTHTSYYKLNSFTHTRSTQTGMLEGSPHLVSLQTSSHQFHPDHRNTKVQLIWSGQEFPNSLPELPQCIMQHNFFPILFLCTFIFLKPLTNCTLMTPEASSNPQKQLPWWSDSALSSWEGQNIGRIYRAVAPIYMYFHRGTCS